MGLGAFGPSAFGPWTQGGACLGLEASGTFRPVGLWAFLFLVFLLVALQIILGFWAFGVVGLGPRSIFGAFGPVGN